MNIGDRVRLIHGNEEGIVVKIVDEKVVEVEIQDGFRIPVLTTELVLVASEEKQYFKAEEVTVPPAIKQEKPNNAQKGIYLAYEPFGNDNVELHLINNTDFNIPYTIYTKKGEQCEGLDCGVLNTKNHTKITAYSLSNFESWSPLHIDIFHFRKGTFQYLEPSFMTFKPKAGPFHKSKKTAPVIGRDAYVFQIDARISPVTAEAIKKGFSEASDSTQKQPRFSKPNSVIDLHIENIVENPQQLSNREILSIQLKTFSNALDRAIITNMDEITFIHGIGNGTLKNNIQKELSKMKNIKFFKDAMKEKFGYGATTVRIK